ncbi:MAG: bacteriochlorophyll 4-vinyl reductase [Pseudomonadota bacterium]
MSGLATLSADKASSVDDLQGGSRLATARIGPNAIIQVLDALSDQTDEATRHAIIAEAGMSPYLSETPTDMVDERQVVRLHQSVRAHLPESRGLEVLRQAGDQTARYILANRIPAPAKAVLRALPARLAAPALLAAIGKHAWTFVGSGRFSYLSGRPTHITLTDCPACQEVYGSHEPSTYFEATFASLFRALVHPGAHIASVQSDKQKQAVPDGRARHFALDW